MANPRYNNARGAATMIGVPPFVFDGVVMRVFPLKASMRALRSFCDQYLNLMPREIAYFEPVVPYVLLSAINYGRMGQETSNLGWVSQNEVVFSVLLKRSRLEGDRLVFEDFASVSPFIYVDDEASLATGREVYGWPKTLAWLTPGINEWARHPESPQDVFVLSAMVFPELFAGQRQQPRELLEIERRPVPSMARLPVDFANALNPLLSLPKAMVEGISVASDLVQAAVGLPLQGYPAREQGQAREMFGKAAENLEVFRRLPVGNTVNFKQFRDARDAAAACYQAVTTAPMTVVRYNGGGLLGELTQMRGDPTGGYSIRLHRYPTQPIVESLGLVVESERPAGDHSVATLRPYFPMWVDLDFKYGRGELVGWRTTQIDWRRDTQVDENPEPPSTSAAKHPYNTARGGATEAITGPFWFPDVTQRVLPLLANRIRLQQFCQEYLDNDFVWFDPWGSYVYMIVTTFEEMASETYNVGWWADRQVTFSFPVRWYKRKVPRSQGGRDATERSAADFELVGTGLVSPFAFTDSDLGATTGREVQGLPMVKAAIECPKGSWLEESGPARRSDLLRLSTDVYPGFNAGQETTWQTLLELTSRPILSEHDHAGWRQIASSWGERLYADLGEKFTLRTTWSKRFDDLRALAIELLRGEGGQPINEVTLRQFRDVEDPETACYQAITVTRTTIENIEELCEIEEPMHVALHRYPNQPIVETLGLEVKHTDAGGSSVVDYLEPIRPFWMKVSMKVDLGVDLFWRAGSETWRPDSVGWLDSRDKLERSMEFSEDQLQEWYREVGYTAPELIRTVAQDIRPDALYLVSGSPDVSTELADRLDKDETLRREIRGTWRSWRFPAGESPKRLTLSEARNAIGEDLTGGYITPQFVIESILDARWGREQPDDSGQRATPFSISADSIGSQVVRNEYAESLEFDLVGRRLEQRGCREAFEEARQGLRDDRYAVERRWHWQGRGLGRYDAQTALLVVDMQNDFADPEGSLFVRGGEVVVGRVNLEIKLATDAGAHVLYTQDWHPESTPHFAKDGGVWPVHCVQGTWGAELHPELSIEERDPIVRKGTGTEDGYSGFSSRDVASGEATTTELARLLEERGVGRVVVAGLALDYCVKATALDAVAAGLQTEVALWATRAVNLDPGDGERVMRELEAAGVRLIPDE